MHPVDSLPADSVSWERMSDGIEIVKARMRKAAGALEDAGVPYAVIGGIAVAAWVSRVDESVARNTRDVDMLVRREDFEAVSAALSAVGFIHRNVRILGQPGSIEMFFDGPEAKARDAVHIVFAQEKVKPDSLEPSPAVEDSESAGEFRLLSLEGLVTMKLTSFRDKDRVHLRDMIEIGLVDASWLGRVPSTLRERLQVLLDDPGG